MINIGTIKKAPPANATSSRDSISTNADTSFGGRPSEYSLDRCALSADEYVRRAGNFRRRVWRNMSTWTLLSFRK
jgi:hypothetical protein